MTPSHEFGQADHLRGAVTVPVVGVCLTHLRSAPTDRLGEFGEVAHVLRVLGGLDALEQVLRSVDGHGVAVLPGLLQFGDGAGDGAGQGVEPVPLLEQAPVVDPQGVHLVDLLGQDPADLRQPDAQRPQHEDLLQQQKLALLVIAVPIGADPGRRQQAGLVVVAQCPGGHARHPGHLRDRPVHRPSRTCVSPGRSLRPWSRR